MDEISKKSDEKTCHDCGANVGEYHLEGCDATLCSICGDQLLVCGHYPDGNTVWTGQMYPELHEIAEEKGLFCRDLVNGEPVDERFFVDKTHEWVQKQDINRHAPCKKDDYGACHDLNRASVLYHGKSE